MASDGSAIERFVDEDFDLDAYLIVGGERLRATVIGLTQTDVRLRSPEQLITGEIVELELGGVGYVLVRICWSRGREAGGVFIDLE